MGKDDAGRWDQWYGQGHTFAPADVMACRWCGNCYYRHEADDDPAQCWLCCGGVPPRVDPRQAIPGDRRLFIKDTPLNSLKIGLASAQSEVARAKRERGSRRRGWKPVSGFRLDRAVPLLAENMYRTSPDQWLRLTAS